MVHVAPCAAALHANRVRSRIDANPFHLRQIDHQAVVAGTQAGAVVPAAPHSQRHLVVASEVD